ncbi:MAG: hypothetical protein NZX77_02875 [Polyangiaceae bacterium]|nr:hypothetical protein [Polyangiaceae bacterium]
MNLHLPPSLWRPATLALLAMLWPLTPAVPLATLSGCGNDGEEAPATNPPVASLGLAEGCQPLLGGEDCFLPYPSSFHHQPDAAMPSGVRYAPSGAGKLLNDNGLSADVGDWMPIDGASKTPTLMTLLGSPVSMEGLVGILDPYDRSATLDSPTLLIEADTGVLIPHFVDVDIREPQPERRALVITPLVGLKEKTRYIAAIRRVKGPDGSLAKAAEGFRRLRDRVNDPELAALLARYEETVFPPLAKLGVDRNELQIAWDFTTGSDELTGRDLRRVRELTLDWLGKNTLEMTVDSVEEPPDNPKVWRTIRGKVKVPLFTEDDQPGSPLHRGPDGAVAQKGEAQVEYVAQIPRSLRDRFDPGLPLAFGHGFFGSRDEVIGDACTEMANTMAMVFVSIDWWGMSTADVGGVAENLVEKPSHTLLFTDRLHQAMANWTVVTAAMRTVFPKQEAFRRPADGQPGTSKDAQGNSNAGTPVFDPARIHFLGISQGHILGGTLAAFNPDLGRIVLHVGGASLTQMMFRARPFSSFLALLSGSMKSPLLQRKYAASMQPLFDRIDPAFWAHYVLAEPLPGSPPDRHVLQQAGIGDVQVPNSGSFLHARLLGLPQITPTPSPVFGLTQVPSPVVGGSAFALYDFGISPEVYRDPVGAPKENPVHGDLRLRPDALEQMNRFFHEDRIEVSNKK